MKFNYRRQIFPYLKELASRGPFGGGSAAALTGATAAALVLKTLVYAVEKVSSPSAPGLKKIEERFLALERDLSAYVDKDAALFSDYLCEKNKYRKERLLKKSSAGAGEVLRCCSEGVTLIGKSHRYVNKCLFSDIMIAFLFFEAAAQACVINQEINNKLLKERQVSLSIRQWEKTRLSRQRIFLELRKEFNSG